MDETSEDEKNPYEGNPVWSALWSMDPASKRKHVIEQLSKNAELDMRAAYDWARAYIELYKAMKVDE